MGDADQKMAGDNVVDVDDADAAASATQGNHQSEEGH